MLECNSATKYLISGGIHDSKHFLGTLTSPSGVPAVATPTGYRPSTLETSPPRLSLQPFTAMLAWQALIHISRGIISCMLRG